MTELTWEALVALIFFVSAYTWSARRGLWLSVSRLDLPGEIYFFVWYTPGLWSLGSLVLLAIQVFLQFLFGFLTPTWFWALTLGGAVGLIDSLIRPN